MRMDKWFFVLVILLLMSGNLYSQSSQLYLNISLDQPNHTWNVKQELLYYNWSKDTLSTILLLDWNHSYSAKNTPLGQRFLENYSKRFFFSNGKSRGYTQVHSIKENNKPSIWERVQNHPDQILIQLDQPLIPGESINLSFDYDLKIPDSKFTGYGYDDGNYHLLDWYLIPATYDDDWVGKSNLDIDQINHDPLDVSLKIQCPEYYSFESNLTVEQTPDGCHLTGRNITGINLEVLRINNYTTFNTTSLEVATNFNSVLNDYKLENQLIQRQIRFLEDYFGVLDVNKLFVSQMAYDKNPLYGFNQLPRFINPFSKSMVWELKFLKTLSDAYVSSLVSTHKQDKDWLSEGLVPYILYKYVSTYYPNQKLIGQLSEIWGIKFYHLSTLSFNERYFIGSQYNLRMNYDQDLKTPLEDLTNYNRLVGQPFKSVNLLLYFEDFFGENMVKRFIKETLTRTDATIPNNTYFLTKIKEIAPTLMVSFIDQLYENAPRMDYKLSKAQPKNDSIEIRIKNKETLQAPVRLIGIKKDTLVSKYWLSPNKDVSMFTLPYNGETQWYLDPKKRLPDVNFNNNFVNTGSGFFRKPLSVRWLSDADNEKKTQLFIEPSLYYNYYDGISIVSAVNNKSMFKKTWLFTLAPAYSFNSEQITGYSSLRYWKYYESELINSLRLGALASYYHYKQDLSYNIFMAFGNVFFKRKNLRDVKQSSINFSYARVDKEPDPNPLFNSANDNYGVFSLNYTYANPGIIRRFLFSQDLEIGKGFSKLHSEIVYRTLLNENRQFEVRWFNGLFIHNNTEDDFFSYGVNRPNDYLFKYNYLGRSESTGLLSRQYIRNDGGFKSSMPVKFANQLISAVNTSTTIWHWVELYADAGFVKNRHESMYFVHDQGLRLNFIDNMLELYLPVHSNNGWEISEPNYHEKIRFVLTTDIRTITSFLKRGKL